MNNPIAHLLLLVVFAVGVNAVARVNPTTASELTTSTSGTEESIVETFIAPKKTPTRAASGSASRRTARIDLKMPYYRFGRLPSRAKE